MLQAWVVIVKPGGTGTPALSSRRGRRPCRRGCPSCPCCRPPCRRRRSRRIESRVTSETGNVRDAIEERERLLEERQPVAAHPRVLGHDEHVVEEAPHRGAERSEAPQAVLVGAFGLLQARGGLEERALGVGLEERRIDRRGRAACARMFFARLNASASAAKSSGTSRRTRCRAATRPCASTGSRAPARGAPDHGGHLVRRKPASRQDVGQPIEEERRGGLGRLVRGLLQGPVALDRGRQERLQVGGSLARLRPPEVEDGADCALPGPPQAVGVAAAGRALAEAEVARPACPACRRAPLPRRRGPSRRLRRTPPPARPRARPRSGGSATARPSTTSSGAPSPAR